VGSEALIGGVAIAEGDAGIGLDHAIGAFRAGVVHSGPDRGLDLGECEQVHKVFLAVPGRQDQDTEAVRAVAESSEVAALAQCGHSPSGQITGPLYRQQCDIETP
jgi:hypothetical protein